MSPLWRGRWGPDDNHSPMVVLGWVIYWLNSSHAWKMLGIYLSSIRCSDCLRLNMPTSRSWLRAAHNCSPLIFLWKEWTLLPRLLFFRQSLRFLGGLGPSGNSTNDCRGPKSRTTPAYLQWCSCYEILWIYFHCTSYNKSSKALDEGLRFAQSHQSSVTYVPQEFMVGSCPASGKTITHWKSMVWRWNLCLNWSLFCGDVNFREGNTSIPSIHPPQFNYSNQMFRLNNTNGVHFPYEKHHIYKRFAGGLAIVVSPNGCPQWADSALTNSMNW